MRFEEKLRKQMLLKGFNQQKLAKLSAVSDSEISRILSGKSSNPGIDNALKLARAIGVSLDYLSDDEIDDDAERPQVAKSSSIQIDPDSVDADILEAARELGNKQARRILETVCAMGYEVAIRRLLDMKPLIEVGNPPRQTAPQVPKSNQRASSA